MTVVMVSSSLLFSPDQSLLYTFELKSADTISFAVTILMEDPATIIVPIVSAQPSKPPLLISSSTIPKSGC